MGPDKRACEDGCAVSGVFRGGHGGGRVHSTRSTSPSSLAMYLVPLLDAGDL